MRYLLVGLFSGAKASENNQNIVALLTEEEKIKFKKEYHATWKQILSLLWIGFDLFMAWFIISSITSNSIQVGKLLGCVLIVLMMIISIILLFLPLVVFWGPKSQIKVFGKTIKEIVEERSEK